MNAWLRGLLKTIVPLKRYRFRFRRKLISVADHASNDLISSIDDLLRGLSFGIVFNTPIASLSLSDANGLGYPLTRGVTNKIIAAKLGRRVGNHLSKQLGWTQGITPVADYDTISTAAGADCTDTEIEIRIEPNGLVWNVILFVAGVQQLAMTTGITIAATTTILPFVHLNAWTTGNTSVEQFTGFELIEEDA